jgi:cell division FtsZ-interacting protein ZapD
MRGAAISSGVFRIIGDLLDIFERGDMRTELLKELERQQQKLGAHFLIQWVFKQNHCAHDINPVRLLPGVNSAGEVQQRASG